VRICIVVSISFCFLIFTKVHIFKLGRNEKIVNYANQGLNLIYNRKERNKMMSNTISILLLLGGGVPEGGGGR